MTKEIDYPDLNASGEIVIVLEASEKDW